MTTIRCSAKRGRQHRGGTENDRLLGGAGGDHLWGDDGNDNLYGGRTATICTAALKNDRLAASDGGSRLEGGTGGDRVIGGAGDDLFVFAAGQAWTGWRISPLGPTISTCPGWRPGMCRWR
ncbi:MAG: hypothetical protein HZT43_05690 [Exiguobacterium profundum]|nr:MAG: hypothetical protein HZT43_05690 [Exiguobacterium profundum]